MIRFWKRAKGGIGFILNQTTRSLKDRASLLKSRRRGKGHMNNIFQARVNSNPQLVFLKSMTSIGKTAPVCDNSFSQLLGAKPVDGLRLSQSLWAKSENLLRSASHVQGTAEEFLLSAVGALLQGKEGGGLAEVKSLLLQVDQALGYSQCLLMGTLANFTLSERRDILEKSSVHEIRPLPLEQREEEQETVPLLQEASATYKWATTYLRDPGFLAPL
jgi:hypothetical protein